MKWFWDWSPSRKKAWIVDAEGFTIIGPVLSKKSAKEIVRKHNMEIGE